MSGIRWLDDSSIGLGSDGLWWYINGAGQLRRLEVYQGISAITSDNTVETNRHVEVDCSSGNVTITLPTTSIAKTSTLEITKVDATFNIITVVCENSETINGESSILIESQWDSATFYKRSSGWGIK